MEPGKCKSAVRAGRSLGTQESQWCRSSLQYGRERPRRAEVADKSQGGLLENPSYSGNLVFLLYSGLQLVGWSPPTLWGAICFLKVYWLKSKNTLQADSKLAVISSYQTVLDNVFLIVWQLTHWQVRKWVFCVRGFSKTPSLSIYCVICFLIHFLNTHNWWLVITV